MANYFNTLGSERSSNRCLKNLGMVPVQADVVPVFVL